MKVFRTFAIVLLVALTSTGVGAQQRRPGPLHYKKLQYPALRPLQIPEPFRVQLENGLIVYLLEDRSLPLIGGSVMVRTGSRYEPADKIGLAGIAGQVMRTGGTSSRTGEELDELLESAGASVETFIGVASGGARLSVLKEDIEMGLQVLADILQHPAFREEKIELAKVSARTAISRRNDQVGSIAFREYNRLIYGPMHPYARITEYATIENITRQDLIDFHTKYYAPNNTILALWGDFDVNEMKKKVDAAFGTWRRKEIAIPPIPQPRLANARSVHFVRKDDVNQSTIYMGHLGGMLNDPESAPLNIADQAFGGASASRLFKRIRTEQGLAYSVGSFWGESFDYPGLFFLSGSTKSETTVKMIRSLLREFEDVVTSGITEDELKYAKDSYLNSFVFRYDTKGKIINQLVTLEYFGYPKDFILRQQSEVQRATREDVKNAVKNRWKPDILTILVVGNVNDFDEPLSAFGAPVKEIDITIPPPPEKIPDPTPETIARAREILKKSQSALGGAKLLSVKDLHYTAKVTQVTPAGEFTLDSEVKILLPDKFVYNMKTPMGEMTTAFDGAIGWITTPRGTEEMPSQARQLYASQVASNLLVALQNYDKPEYAVHHIGDEQFNGTSIAVVVMRYLPLNHTFRYFIDTKTGLVVKKIAKTMTPSGLADVEEVYSEYRTVDGIHVPFKTIVTSGKQKVSETVISSLKVNSGLSRDSFKRP
jgi:predicted Zn-dependent peptidase/outer membrane lipoprotein-sorting protein